MSAHPDFLALLKDFAFGQAGSDKLRLDAAQTLSKHNAAPNGMVDMWLKGKWTPILLLGFEITPEPIFDIPVNPKALALLKQSLEALRNDESGEAERILRRALQLQPEHPSLLNNLALALAMQDKHDASEAIRKHLVEDFPNYFLGQISQALKLLQDGDVEKARAIVNHWMETKKKFHTTEFSALCKAQINLMLEDGKPEGADSWLKMWERVYPDDPELEHYEQFIKIRNGVSRIFRK
jgi:tetratricopeptide (TPR) repeat protein